MLYHNPRPWWLRISRETFYSVYNPIKRLYWFLFRPVTKGVKVIALNKNRILLVRIGYGHKKWVLPGGKVDRGEGFKQAALRELKEESGFGGGDEKRRFGDR